MSSREIVLSLSMLLAGAGVPGMPGAAAPAQDQVVMCGGGERRRPADQLDYFLYDFATEAAATRAARELDTTRFRHHVRTAALGAGWVLYIDHRTLPDVAGLATSDALIAALANKHGIRFSGHSCGRQSSRSVRASQH